jgi:hypothetical protein
MKKKKSKLHSIVCQLGQTSNSIRLRENRQQLLQGPNVAAMN